MSLQIYIIVWMSSVNKTPSKKTPSKKTPSWKINTITMPGKKINTVTPSQKTMPGKKINNPELRAELLAGLHNDVQRDDVQRDNVQREVYTLDQPYISPKPHAYVWLIMFGDAYLPGIFVSMFSVKKQNPKADLVVMVTDDVSRRAIDVMYKIADAIYKVPYITHETTPMVGKQVAYYSSWINSSFTKWNALALPYKKVVFIDGDTLCLDPIDDLFDMQTPAAPWSNPWMEPMGRIPNRYSGPLLDGYPPHKALITPAMFSDVFKRGGMLFTANAVVLTPSQKDYREYLKLIDKNNKND